MGRNISHSLKVLILGSGLAMAGCDDTPETSRLKKDDVTYTLMEAEREGQNIVALHSYAGSTSTVYMFNKKSGYTAYEVTAYPGINFLTGAPNGRSVSLAKSFKASLDDEDHGLKLGIGCELAAQMAVAPAKTEAVEKDRAKGRVFKEEYCP